MEEKFPKGKTEGGIGKAGRKTVGSMEGQGASEGQSSLVVS